MNTSAQPKSKIYALPKKVVNRIHGLPSLCRSITINDGNAILYARSDYVVRITLPLSSLLSWLLCCLYPDIPTPDKIKVSCYYQADVGNASIYDEYIGFLSMHKVEDFSWLYVQESNYVGFTEEVASIYLEILKDVLV